MAEPTTDVTREIAQLRQAYQGSRNVRAQRSGLSTRTWAKIDAGTTVFTRPVAWRIAQALRKPMDDAWVLARFLAGESLHDLHNAGFAWEQLERILREACRG